MFARLLLAAVLAIPLAYAQGSRGGDMGGMGGDTGGMGGSGGRGGDMGAGMSMPRVQRQTKFEMIADKLKLNNDQKQEAGTILQASAQEAAPVRNLLLRGRDAIANAMLSGKSDADIKKLLNDYAGVAAQMTGIEVKAYTKIYAMLKPNQQSKAGQAFELMAGIFEQGMPGGGRGMGRGMNR